MTTGSSIVGRLAALVLSSFGALATTPARAEPAGRAVETPKSPEHAIVADLGLHVVGVAYQVDLRPWLAGQLALDGYVPWAENLHVLGPKGAPNTDVAGLVVRQRLFFHPLGHAPEGPWISPFAQYGFVVATRDGDKRVGGAVAGGLTAGWSFLLVRRLLLGLGGGAQYNAAHVPGGRGAPSFGGFRPTVDIQLGYAF